MKKKKTIKERLAQIEQLHKDGFLDDSAYKLFRAIYSQNLVLTFVRKLPNKRKEGKDE